MTTQMVKATQSTSLSIQDVMTVSKTFFDSGLFVDVRGASQAAIKIMAGQELGIPPFASMNGIQIIKGKAALGANVIAAMIKRSGKYTYVVKENSAERCEIEFFEIVEGKRLAIGTSEFSIQDARKAGTQNLDKFARNMLFARALTNGARWHTPDVFLGPIYTPEELGATVDEEGNVIDVTPVQPVRAEQQLNEVSGSVFNIVRTVSGGKQWIKFTCGHTIVVASGDLATRLEGIQQGDNVGAEGIWKEQKDGTEYLEAREAGLIIDANVIEGVLAQG